MTKTVIVGERPAAVDKMINERHRLGQDVYDEVWEGDLHVVSVPPPWHGRLVAEVSRLIAGTARASRHEVVVMSGVRLGEEGNFRVPDTVVLDALAPCPPDYPPRALVVVEIVAPDDESFDKFGFYWDQGVEEILTIEQDRRVTWWERRSAYRPVLASDILGTSTDYFSDQIRWP